MATKRIVSLSSPICFVSLPVLSFALSPRWPNRRKVSPVEAGRGGGDPPKGEELSLSLSIARACSTQGTKRGRRQGKAN